MPAPAPGRTWLVASDVPELPPPRLPRAVIVVVGNERAEAEHAITAARQRAYAEACGAEWIVLRGLQPQRHAAGYKYAAAAVAARYEQALFLDCDVVPFPDAPSIFKQVPLGEWGLVDDFPGIALGGAVAWFDGELATLCATQERPVAAPRWTGNTGVMVMPPDAHRLYAPPPRPVPATMWCAEQHWATLLMLGRPEVRTLEAAWNACWFRADFPQLLEEAHLVHAAGCSDHNTRLPLLAAWARGERVAPRPPASHRGFRPSWAL